MMDFIQAITERLLPGQDLKQEIERLTNYHNMRAGCVLSIVGSLSGATLRLADGKTVMTRQMSFEIVSGTGTLSKDGCHIHLAVADEKGYVFGGHLKEGCIIKTTAELVFLVFTTMTYRREFDPKTGYNELVISDK